MNDILMIKVGYSVMTFNGIKRRTKKVHLKDLHKFLNDLDNKKSFSIVLGR